MFLFLAFPFIDCNLPPLSLPLGWGICVHMHRAVQVGMLGQSHFLIFPMCEYVSWQSHRNLDMIKTGTLKRRGYSGLLDSLLQIRGHKSWGQEDQKKTVRCRDSSEGEKGIKNRLSHWVQKHQHAALRKHLDFGSPKQEDNLFCFSYQTSGNLFNSNK